MRAQYTEVLYYSGTMTPVVNTGVVVYLGNTLTLADLSIANGTALDNPVYTDQDGSFTFWADIGLYDIYVYGTKLASVTLDGVSGGVELTQPSFNTAMLIASVDPSDTAAPQVQIAHMSYPNTGAGAGTYNQALFLGHNTGWHSTQPTEAGKPSIMIGLESNYYDNVDPLGASYGREFYVESYSPDGSNNAPAHRPIYARGEVRDDLTSWWNVNFNIGNDPTRGQWGVYSGTTPLAVINGSGLNVYSGAYVRGQLEVVDANVLLSNNKFVAMENLAGTGGSILGVGTDNDVYFGDVFGTMGGGVKIRTGNTDRITVSSIGVISLGTGVVNIGSFLNRVAGPAVASATTIAPAYPIFHVTGTTAIATITIPYVGFVGEITIIPDAAFTTTTAGNIGIASTGVIGKALIMTYDGTKWYPSY